MTRRDSAPNCKYSEIHQENVNSPSQHNSESYEKKSKPSSTENTDPPEHQPWKQEDVGAIVDLYTIVYHQWRVFGFSLSILKATQARFERYQYGFGLLSAVIAFLTASPFPDLVANIAQLQPDSVSGVMQISVGILALLIAHFNDKIKERNFPKWIGEYELTIREYANLKLEIETEIEFPTRHVHQFEVYVSGKLQEFEERHNRTKIPRKLERKYEEFIALDGNAEIAQCFRFDNDRMNQRKYTSMPRVKELIDRAEEDKKTESRAKELIDQAEEKKKEEDSDPEITEE